MKKPKFIVLGANGYIGRHMSRLLADKGCDLLAVDIQKEPAVENIPYLELDITDKVAAENSNLTCDFIFYLCGLTGTSNGFDNYERYVKVNEIGLLNLLNTIRRCPQKPRIIFPSTRLVYKGSDTTVSEEGEKEAKTIYAINKLTCENILRAYENVFRIPYTICRICVPYGNLFDQNYSFGSIAIFLKKSKNAQPIILYGDGSQKRTFTHIEDICEQLLLAGTHPAAVNNVYNLSGEAFSLREVATLFADKYNVKVGFCPWPKNDLLIETGHTVFNSEKIEKLLNRLLKYKLADWIRNDEE